MAGQLAPVRFEKRHNSSLRIDRTDPDAPTYLPMLDFVERSRVHRALTMDHHVDLTYIGQFWTTAQIDTSVDPTVIRATVARRQVVLSRDIFRRVLDLGNDEVNSGPREYPLTLRVGAFLRMGYHGNINQFPYLKANLHGPWRFLMHILIQSLAARKSAYDGMNARLASLMIGLVYNKPYDIAGFLYDECCNQLQLAPAHRWLLYPRFIQAVIRSQLGNLPVDPHQDQVAVMERRIYRDCRPARRPRPDTPLFGAILNETYLPPPHHGFNDIDAVFQDPPVSPPPAQAPVLPPDDQQAVLEDVFAQEGQAGFDPRAGEEVVHQVLFGEELPHDDDADIDQYHASSPAQVISPTTPQSEDDLFEDDVVSNAAAQESEESLGSDDTNDEGDSSSGHDSDNDIVAPMRYQVSRHVGSSSSHGKRIRDSDSDYQPSPSSQDSTALIVRPRRAKRVRTESLVTTAVGESPAVSMLSMAMSLPSSLPMLTVAMPTPDLFLSTTLALTASSSPATMSSTIPTFVQATRVSVSLPSTLSYFTPATSPEFSPESMFSTGVSVDFASLSPPVSSSVPIVPLPTIASLNARIDGLQAQLNDQNQLIAAQTTLLAQQGEMLKLVFAQGEKTAKCVDRISRVFRYDDRDDDAAQREQPRPSHPTGFTATATTQGEPSQVQGKASGSGDMQRKDADLGSGDLIDKLLAGYDYDLHSIPGFQESNQQLDLLDFSSFDPTQGEPIHFSHEDFEIENDIPASNIQIDIDQIRAVVEDESILVQSSEAATVTEPTHPKHRDWFRTLPKAPVYKDTINLESARQLTSRIISWFWDNEIKLFALKRLDGVQYLRCSPEVFSSLSIHDLKDLSRLPLVNPIGSSRAGYIETIVSREGGSGKFKVLQPAKPKYVKDPSGTTNPISGRRYYEAIYSEIKYEKKIPLKKLPQNILRDLSYWQVDDITGEAIMYDSDYKQILRLYDPLHLVNLSKDDLDVLHGSKLVVAEELKVLGDKYTQIVKSCILKNVHADCDLFV